MDEHIAGIDILRRKRNKDAIWPNEATWTRNPRLID
jgi:hypothetical protein